MVATQELTQADETAGTARNCKNYKRRWPQAADCPTSAFPVDLDLLALGQIWSASGVHYGFKVDPSYWKGVFGGASYRTANTVSYSSSAGDVSFQLDKSTGDDAGLELGASATLGPVGIGLGYASRDDDSGFTGLAVSAGAAGVNLTIGMGSSTEADGTKWKQNVLNVGGSLGDSGLSYALQVANSDQDRWRGRSEPDCRD